MTNKVVVIVIVLSFFIVCSISGQTFSEEKTSLVWCEINRSHYTTGWDTACKGYAGFIAYDSTYDSVRVQNYQIGYYEIINQHRFQPEGDSLPLLEVKSIMSNKVIYNKFKEHIPFPYTEAKNRLLYNQFWAYQLCRLTYREVFMGNLLQFVPDYSSSDKSPNLEYHKIRIPTYLIELIKIEPVYDDFSKGK